MESSSSSSSLATCSAIKRPRLELSDANDSSIPLCGSTSTESGDTTLGSHHRVDVSSSSSTGPLYPSDSESEQDSRVVLPVSSPSGDDGSESESLSDDEQTSKELTIIGHILVSSCGCELACLRHLTAHDVLTSRSKFRNLSRNAQRQWLVDKIADNSRKTELQSPETKYIVAGREVCQSAWCKVHGVTSRRLARIKRSVSLGHIKIEHGNKGVKRPSLRTEDATAWMRRYFHLIGDKMPHNRQIHLPSWETQKDVYLRYRDDMMLQNMPESGIVALSTFYRIWSEDFPDVIIPEVCDKSPFYFPVVSVCIVCSI